METKLYVGNLSYNIREDELRLLFSDVGSVVSVMIVRDRGSGQSRGFGFVEMSSQAEAGTAVAHFNGFKLGGRELKVNVARSREGRGGRQGGGRGRQGRGYRNKRYDSRY